MSVIKFPLALRTTLIVAATLTPFAASAYGVSNFGYTNEHPITGAPMARVHLFSAHWQEHTNEYEIIMSCFANGRVSIDYHTGGHDSGRDYYKFVVKVDDQQAFMYEYDPVSSVHYGLHKLLKALSKGNTAYIKAVDEQPTPERHSPYTAAINLNGSARAIGHIYKCMETVSQRGSVK